MAGRAFCWPWWVTLIYPVFVTLLLARVSGVPLLEKRADEKWGGREDYQAYNRQELRQVLAEFKTSRQESLTFYRALRPNDWERPGQHEAFGPWSVGNMIIFVGWHGGNHIEQITRILVQANGEKEHRSKRIDYK